MKGFIKNTSLLIAGALLGGAALHFGGYAALHSAIKGAIAAEQAEQTVQAKAEPLYWVAPMDPNYRRDKPGKSPMGMDLIPVYEEGVGNGPDAGPGTIEFSPEVINNLGVRTGVAQRQPLAFNVRTVGYVQYDEDRLVHVHPRVEGWVERLYVKAAGEAVEKGQPLYELYSPELVNAQEELIFALEQGDRRLRQAAEARLRALDVGEQTLEAVKSKRQVSQTVTFHAPMSGVVDDFAVREGLFIKPGTTMMSIASLDEVWVEAEVFERQADLVKAGQLVTMTLDYLPGQHWTGVVDYVYPALDAKTRTLRVRVRFANPLQTLKPNMFAEVNIDAGSEEAVLTVPREAIIRGGMADRLVLALGDGRFKSIEVTTGRSDEEWVEIVEGLAAGERVVTSAQFLIDSESSKTSDFKRMNTGEGTAQMDHSRIDRAPVPASAEKASKPSRVWVEAHINQVMAVEGKINVDHGPVDAWKWPAMTMDFAVSEWVDLETLSPGMKVQIEIGRLDAGGFEINDLFVVDDDTAAAGGGYTGDDLHQTTKSVALDHAAMGHDAHTEH